MGETNIIAFYDANGNGEKDSEEVFGSYALEVVADLGGEVASVTFEEASLDLEFPDNTNTGTLSPVITSADPLNPTVLTAANLTWESDDESVATVSSSGVVTATGVGSATIKATLDPDCASNVYFAECVVTVTATHGRHESSPLDADEAYAKALLVTSNNANDGKIYYVQGVIVAINSAYSSEHGNISVDLETSEHNIFRLYRVTVTEEQANQMVKGVIVMVAGYITKYNTTYETAQGASFVSATANEVTLAEISGSSSVEQGQTTQLSLVTYPTSAPATGEVEWSSNNEAIATVSSTGLVTGVAQGTVTITATYSEESVIVAIATKSIDVTLTPVAMPAGGLSFTYDSLGIADNATYASNNNRTVTLNGLSVVIDPNSEGTIMKSSGAYTTGGALGIQCIQFKAGKTIAKVATPLISATKVTVVMYATYASEGAAEFPSIKFGSTTVAQTETITGVDTGKKSGSYAICRYEVVYDISALSNSQIEIIGGAHACQIESLVIE